MPRVRFLYIRLTWLAILKRLSTSLLSLIWRIEAGGEAIWSTLDLLARELISSAGPTGFQSSKQSVQHAPGAMNAQFQRPETPRLFGQPAGLRRKCCASVEIGVQITSFEHHSTFEMSEQVSSPSSEQAASPKKTVSANNAAESSSEPPKVQRYATEAAVLALMTNDKFKKFCKKKCGE